MGQSEEFFVYLLQSSAGQTYVGATVDLDRRLRQHNKEIKGGAYATGAQVAKGEVWQRACYVSGFPTWQAALQFEWRWKQLSRADKSIAPMERRMNALKKLLALDRATSKAIPYAEWPAPPQVHYECEILQALLVAVGPSVMNAPSRRKPSLEGGKTQFPLQ